MAAASLLGCDVRHNDSIAARVEALERARQNKAVTVNVESSQTCWDVVILDVRSNGTGSITLMEAEESKARFTRGEFYGNAGDKFKYCE
jgi:hypothetical protein